DSGDRWQGYQTAALDKVGGLPFGVDPARWPRCTDCGQAMSHIAQFVHDKDRLDLRHPGRVLTLWQCEHDPGMCETWSATSGANCAMVGDVNEAFAGLAAPPDERTAVFPEARAIAWTEGDDGVTQGMLPEFFDEVSSRGLDPAWRDPEGFTTRLGAVPTFIQSSDEAPGAPWCFVGQLSNGEHINGSAPSANDPDFGVQRAVNGTWELERQSGNEPKGWIVVDESGWYLPGPNFGDGGMAYLFLDATSEPPAACMFWQCG
ncbi:MAG: hypothetical protein DLM58_12785, partial [Pseudonocardiales bacterium]